MPFGKTALLAAALALAAAVCHANAIGKSPKNPFTFSDFAPWIGDSRPSLDLFRETLRMDFAAVRFNGHFGLTPVYVILDNNRVYQSALTHVTFQGMFWGPLLAAGVWMVPFGLFDAVNTLLAGKDPGTIMIPIGMLGLYGKAYEEQALSDILRINVLFTSDVLMLGLKKIGGNVYYSSIDSVIGRSYAGLCFKILKNNYFFAGFNFVHIPHVSGWSNFVTTNAEYSNGSAVDVYDSQTSAVVYETRAKILLCNNLLDFFEILSLLNLDSSQLLDMLGAGFLLKFGRYLDLRTALDYLAALNKYSVDLSGTSEFSDVFSLNYKWNFSVYPFRPLDFLRAGLNVQLSLAEDKNGGKTGFTVRAKASLSALTYWLDGGQKFGGAADISVAMPPGNGLKFGVGYNSDETMLQLPMYQDNLSVYFSVEFLMDDTATYKDLLRGMNKLLEAVLNNGKND